ncbi:MAG: PIN domain-containing protein [Propionibacteriaceae bacterium]|nr:PIN domain-containing protein [Propionibacteriaceae bacterium]
MNHPIGLLDTSTVLRMDELEPSELPDEIVICAITLAELSVGPLVTNDETERAARQAQVQEVEADYGDPLPFDAAAARAFAQVSADLRRNGGKSRVRTFDALIAAIAKAAQLPLYTFNARDFAPVTGVEIVALPSSHV